MSYRHVSVVAAMVCWCCLGAAGAEATSQPAPGTPEAPRSLAERDTFTDNWFGAGPALAEKGLAFSCSLIQNYQANVHGGLSTDGDRGRYQGRYDLEFKADLNTLAGLKGANLYASARGGWTPGIGPRAVGGLFDVNTTACDEPIVLRQLYYEQNFLDKRIRIRLGRVDLTGGFECRGCKVSFDGNRFANDEGSQFLNSSLVNNPTIPFPSVGMGAMVHVEPVEGWYVTVGAADANALQTRSGFDTSFDSPCEFFSIYETGLVPEFASPRGPWTTTPPRGWACSPGTAWPTPT
ncbi:MAG: carbohydrate porin [Planctomycetota bacterium]|nr:carbohydrate porin [Planctomycetota bacterium]